MAEEDYIAIRTKRFANGDVYTGTWSQASVPDGEGKYVWRDGSTYEGSWKEGAKDGVGKYTWPSGATYHGEWREGSMHGVGTWESTDGLCRYQGGWHHDLKHGLGRQVYANGDVYEGLWKLGSPDGPGRYVYGDGNEYDGEWRQGRMHGHGTFVWRSGERYDGEWKDGRMHGCGLFTAADGSTYDGCWRRGRKHGVGILKPGQGQGQAQGQGQGQGAAHHGPAGQSHGPGWSSSPSEGGAAAAAAAPGGGGGGGSSVVVGRGAAAHGGKAPAGQAAAGLLGNGGYAAASAAAGVGNGADAPAGYPLSPTSPTTHSLATAPSGTSSVGADVFGGGGGGGGPGGPGGPGGGLQDAAGGGPSGGPGSSLVSPPGLSPLSPLAPIMFPSLPPSAPDSPRSPRVGSVTAGGTAWMWAAAAAAGPAATGYPSVTASATSGTSPAASAAPSHVGSRQNLVGAAGSAAPGGDQLQNQQQQQQRQGRGHGQGQGQGQVLEASVGIHLGPAAAGTAGAQRHDGRPVASHPIPVDSAPAEIPAPHLQPQPQPPLPPGATGQPLPSLPPPHHHQQQQQQQHQQQRQRMQSNSGSAAAAAGGGKLVFIRVYDKGRPVRETALSQDEMEALMPPGLLALGRRGSGANHLLRLLRGGSVMGGGSRPRPWPRMGDTVTRAHSSYALMVALQLGIRYSVGRISHEPLPRSVSSDEYSLRVQQEFPRGGSETTPVHPVEDFTWSDYAPVTFRRLRESFGLDASTYMLSLCADQSLRHLASPGKSGSVFFLSQDERFFIKTMSRAEMAVLLSSLPAYHRHVDRHPHTLLCRFFGVHCVTTPAGRKYRFVVMSNIFRTPLQLHRKFDLKGSTLGRTAGKPPADDPTIIFKDLDLDLRLRLEDGWRDRLLFQLRADCGLLSGVGVMDYSLLVGVHFRNRGGPGAGGGGGQGGAGEAAGEPSVHPHPARQQAAANHREHNESAKLALEYPRVEERIHRLSQRLGLGEAATGDLIELAKMRMLSPRGRAPTLRGSPGAPHHPSSLPDQDAAASQRPGRRGPRGGAGGGDGSVSVSVNDTLALSMGQSRVQLGLNMAATAVFKDGREEEAVIWFALIDILQPYNTTKRLEHSLKSVIHSSQSISVTHPSAYASRFQAFMKQVFD